MPELAPPYPLIRQKLEAGGVIPFLGAGASLGTRAAKAAWQKGSLDCLPTGNELAKHLAETTEFPSEEAVNLATVAQYFDVVGGRRVLSDELHAIFDGDYPIGSVHTYLASIDAPLLIITTNYDDLMERALRQRGKSFDVVVHTTNAKHREGLYWWQHGSREPRVVAPNKLDIDLSKVTVVYKMHGAIDRGDRERDQYVITEDDYVEFLLRMTRNKAIPAVFADPVQSRHFLFLGYGLYDWNMRVVLSRIVQSYPPHENLASWAIQRSPSALERLLWQRRKVEVYAMQLDDFVKALSDRGAGKGKKGRKS